MAFHPVVSEAFSLQIHKSDVIILLYGSSAMNLSLVMPSQRTTLFQSNELLINLLYLALFVSVFVTFTAIALISLMTVNKISYYMHASGISVLIWLIGVKSYLFDAFLPALYSINTSFPLFLSVCSTPPPTPLSNRKTTQSKIP